MRDLTHLGRLGAYAEKWKEMVFRVLSKYNIVKGEERTVAVYILSDYIYKALAQAVYEKLEDGTYAGKITGCTGFLAFGKSLRECEEELQSTLEDWVLVGFKKGHELLFHLSRLGENDRSRGLFI